MAQRLAIRATKAPQSLGLGLSMIGFGLLAVGGSKIARAAAAARRAAMEEAAAQGVAGTTSDGGIFAKVYYEGGFESPMTKREAALILGCRESASKEKILDRYRVLIRLNHPDMGGSPLIAAKINEAKNLLSLEARSDPNYNKEKERQAKRNASKENEGKTE